MLICCIAFIKKMKEILKIAVFVITILSVSCDEKSLIEKHFNSSEIITINKIINYYDNWIISETGEQNISSAYLQFLEKVQPKVLKENTTEYLLPDKENVRKFLATLELKNLDKIYLIEDYHLSFDQNKSAFDTIASPYSLRINYPGKFISFLNDLKTKKKFFRPYFEYIDLEAHIGPAAFAEIILGYEEINFKKRDERLVFIITIIDLM
jgi:hypothetical protein